MTTETALRTYSVKKSICDYRRDLFHHVPRMDRKVSKKKTVTCISNAEICRGRSGNGGVALEAGTGGTAYAVKR